MLVLSKTNAQIKFDLFFLGFVLNVRFKSNKLNVIVNSINVDIVVSVFTKKFYLIFSLNSSRSIGK